MSYSQLKISNQVIALALFMLVNLTSCNCERKDNQDPSSPKTSSDANTGGTNTEEANSGGTTAEEANTSGTTPGKANTGEQTTEEPSSAQQTPEGTTTGKAEATIEGKDTGAPNSE